MRIDHEERELFARLAQRERRPVADVIRGLVRKAVQESERPAKADALSVSRA
jgi:hypothetical protein